MLSSSGIDSAASKSSGSGALMTGTGSAVKASTALEMMMVAAQ